jgi:hypothetical protein
MSHRNTADAIATPTFGSLTIGNANVTLELADRQPNGRGYFLDDDRRTVVFGPDPDPQTLANGIASMVMLLGLRSSSSSKQVSLPRR